MTEETKELTLIEKRVATFNEFESQISNLREKCKIKINGVEDKENYAAAKERKKEVNQLIKNTNEVEKRLTGEAMDYKNRVKDVSSKIKSDLTEIKEPLDEEIKRIDEEKRAIREAKKEAEERKYNERIAALLEHGAAFNGSTYEVGEFSCTPVQLREVSDQAFKTLLSAAKEGAAEVAKQKRIKEEKEAKERKELEKQKRELEAERKKIEAEREELRQLRAAAKRIEKPDNELESKPAPKPIEQPQSTQQSPKPLAPKKQPPTFNNEAKSPEQIDRETCEDQLIQLIRSNSDVVKSLDFKTDKYLKIRNKIHETHMKMIEWIKNNE